MDEEYYCDDDYDQEYAEGYSAYKYDNEDYDSGYEDGPEYAEEEYVEDYIDDCVDDADYDVSHEESVQKLQKETPQASGIAPHHIMLGAAGAALGHAVAKTEHTHPQRAVQSTHFWAENRIEIGLKNGAYPFNIA